MSHDDGMAWWADPRSHEHLGEIEVLRHVVRMAIRHVPAASAHAEELTHRSLAKARRPTEGDTPS